MFWASEEKKRLKKLGENNEDGRIGHRFCRDDVRLVQLRVTSVLPEVTKALRLEWAGVQQTAA